MAFRWAIAGCGEIARVRVAPAMIEDRNSELVAVADTVPERARRLAERSGDIAAFPSLDELLREVEVDGVYVATPPRSHCEPALAAAEAGRHVLCEKPMAADLDDCHRMIDACEKAGVELAVSYYRRWYPTAREIKRLIDEGAIGRPLRARVLTGWPNDPDPSSHGSWRVDAGGGPLMDTACHRIDLICYWLGEPARVSALTGTLERDWEAPDIETLICEMVSGCHLTCETQWSMPVSTDRIEIHGTEGSIVSTTFDGEHFTRIIPGREDRIALEGRAENVHLPLIASFAERVAAGRAPEFEARESLQTSRIIDAAHRSACSGRREVCRRID